MSKFRYLRETSPAKTLLFNLRYFGLGGLRLPVLVSRNFRLARLGGSVELGGLRFAAVRLGYSGVGIVDHRSERGIWQVEGTVRFRGSAYFGAGARISCGRGGVMEFGGGFQNSARGTFICHDSLAFGEGCLVSWDTLFIDDDFHRISGQPTSAPVRVGARCWVGCGATVLRGAVLPDGSVVGARSTVTRPVEAVRPLVVGANRVVRENVSWEE